VHRQNTILFHATGTIPWMLSNKKLTFNEVANFVALSLVEHAAHLKVEIFRVVELVVRVECCCLTLGAVNRAANRWPDTFQDACITNIQLPSIYVESSNVIYFILKSNILLSLLKIWQNFIWTRVCFSTERVISDLHEKGKNHIKWINLGLST
jgi:hypothetical protein